MKIETHACDVCGKQKQQSNHWFKLLPSASGPGFHLYRWNEVDGDTVPGAKHLCSEGCSSKELSEWMSKGQKQGDAVSIRKEAAL